MMNAATAQENWSGSLADIALPAASQTVYIWGAGNTAVLAHQGMLREGLYEYFHITGYLDSKTAGTTLNGFPVGHPDILNALDAEKVFILICSGNRWMYEEISAALEKKGIRYALLDAAVMKVKKEEYIKAAALMDERSKEIYFYILTKRLTLEPVAEEYYAGESYFGIPEFCVSRPDDVFVDCGAYVGDSVERYLWRMDKFKKIIAIEPDKCNFDAMRKRFERLREEWALHEDKLTALMAGVNDITTSKYVANHLDGLSSIVSDENSSANAGVELWALDDLIQDQVTYIKADIESYEYKMLCGAGQLIRDCRPRIAVCIYHNAVDLYSIPLLLSSLNPKYRFAVRHHSYSEAETVLYVY